MRANHSPLQFFGLIATASALAYGVYANAALAGTMASTTESNGASASRWWSVRARRRRRDHGVSWTQRGQPSIPIGLPAAMRSVTTATAWRVVESHEWPSGGRLGDPWAAGQVTATAAPAKAAPPTPAGRSTRVDVGVTPLIGGRDSAGAPTGATAPSATTTTTAPPDPSPADSAARDSGGDSGLCAAGSLPAAPGDAAAAAAPPPRHGPRRPSLAHKSRRDGGAHHSDRPRHRPSRHRRARQAQSRQILSRQNLSRRSRSRLSRLRCPRATEGRRLIQLQTSVTRWLRAEKDEATRLVTPTDARAFACAKSPLVGAGHRTARSRLSDRRASSPVTPTPSVGRRARLPRHGAPKSRRSGRPSPARAPPRRRRFRRCCHRRLRFRHDCLSVARLQPAAVVSARSHPPSWPRLTRSLSCSRRSSWCASPSIVRRGDRHCSCRDSSTQADHHG